jgi:hypothetical protein
VVVINNTITCPVGHYCPQGGSDFLYAPMGRVLPNLSIYHILPCL